MKLYKAGTCKKVMNNADIRRYGEEMLNYWNMEDDYETKEDEEGCIIW